MHCHHGCCCCHCHCRPYWYPPVVYMPPVVYHPTQIIYATPPRAAVGVAKHAIGAR